MQVNYIINNFLSHHKKRYSFRFIDDNNQQVIKLVFTYFALAVPINRRPFNLLDFSVLIYPLKVIQTKQMEIKKRGGETLLFLPGEAREMKMLLIKRFITSLNVKLSSRHRAKSLLFGLHNYF